jgi:pimeloyl-ACP methyl ester carboxylesterase
MPAIVRRTIPWLRLDVRRIYAIGGSMGGQETLLLLARHPRLLAGAAAFDAVTNMALQYRSFRHLPCSRSCRRAWHGPVGRALQVLAREEIGGTPRTRPLAYSLRSPVTYARAIAASCVPLQLWWSLKDRIVLNQQYQSGALFRRIADVRPDAPVTAFVGWWSHSKEMRAETRLPVALAAFGLLPIRATLRPPGIRVFPPSAPVECGLANRSATSGPS